MRGPHEDPFAGDPGPELPPGIIDAMTGGALPGEKSFLDRLMTAREFCEMERPPPERLAGALGMRGERLVVAGETGKGKSTLCSQMIRCIVHGGEFLKYQCPGVGRALILDAEQGGITVERRFRALGLHESDKVDILAIPEGASLDTRPIERQWLEEVLEGGGYSVVLADPLYKLFRGGHESGDGGERAAVEFMRWWDRWRLGADGRWDPFLLVLPMHARKPPPGTKFSMAEIFGSSAWIRGCEKVVGIQYLSPGYSQLHFWKDRDGFGEEPENEGDPTFASGEVWGLTFTREDGFKKGADAAKEGPREAIIRLLSTSAIGMSIENLMDAIPGKNGRPPASRSTIERHLRKLGDMVVARQDGNGEKWWELSDPVGVGDEQLEHWQKMVDGETNPGAGLE